MIELVEGFFFEIWLIVQFLAVVAFETFWRTVVFVSALGFIFYVFRRAFSYHHWTARALGALVIVVSVAAIVGSVLAAFTSLDRQDVPSFIVFLAITLFFIGVLRHLLRSLYNAKASAKSD